MRIALLFLLILQWSCASNGVSEWRPKSATQPLAAELAAPLAGVVAGLYADTGGEGDWLEVVELRVLAMDERPWIEVDPEAAVGRSPLGLVVHRVCRRVDGLGYQKRDRSSWMIFENQALIAFDHGRFGPGCTLERVLRPAGTDRLDLERGLVRYTAQRFPAGRPTLDERMKGAMVLVEVGRLEDAERVLKLANSRIDQMKDDLDATYDDTRPALELQLDRSRALHGALRRALKAARADERASASPTLD